MDKPASHKLGLFIVTPKRYAAILLNNQQSLQLIQQKPAKPNKSQRVYFMRKKFGIASGESSDETELVYEQKKPRSEKLSNDVSELEKLLGYTFNDKTWLIRALTHRSVPGSSYREDYERLEFLGDAVIDLAVAHLLLHQHKEAKEGELSKMRAALVNSSSLAEVARNLNLGPFIKLSRGEAASGGADRDSILSDVLEAVTGAIYKDAGFDKSLEVIEAFFGDLIKDVTPQDSKTELQEILHAKGFESPKYLLEFVEGPEHAPTFVSVVDVDGNVLGRGTGTTKKASQQAAALEALKLLTSEDNIDNMFSLPKKVKI